MDNARINLKRKTVVCTTRTADDYTVSEESFATESSMYFGNIRENVRVCIEAFLRNEKKSLAVHRVFSTGVPAGGLFFIEIYLAVCDPFTGIPVLSSPPVSAEYRAAREGLFACCHNLFL